MNAKSRFKLLITTATALAIALIAAFCMLFMSGCIGEPSIDKILADSNAANQKVTYYANGGTFDRSGNKTTKTLYYQPNVYVISNFEYTNNISIERDNYQFDHWEYVELGEDNTPVVDADGNVKSTGVEVDFTQKIQENETWYVIAIWEAVAKVDIYVVTDHTGGITVVSGGTTTVFNSGDLITSRAYESSGKFIIDDSDPISNRITTIDSQDHTFVYLFKDEECTIPATTFTLSDVETENGENVKLYAKYIYGDWTIVRSTKTISTMLKAATGNFYVFSATATSKVIDCSSLSTFTLSSRAFTGTIEGNGYTLKGLSYTISAQTAGQKASIFGNIGDGAVIKDLTIDSATISATVKVSNVGIYVIANSVSAGATLSNFAVTNCKYNITISASRLMDNITSVNGGYESSTLFFGGVENDKEILSEYVTESGNIFTMTVDKTVYTVNRV